MEYDDLSPDRVLNAVESQGLAVDGRYIVLNSYENRVYQVNLDDQDPVIAKFYRPKRWSNETLIEEHAYTLQLAEHELPVIAPWQNTQGETLFEFEGHRFTIYPRKGGHPPEPGHLDQLYRLGGLMGRMHAIGATHAFEHRPALSIESHCIEPSAFLLEHDFIPPEHQSHYQALINEIAELIETAWQTVPHLQTIRTHGDCHLSNIIWSRDDRPWLLDFDDCRMAPAIQDLWMLIHGEPDQQALQLSELLEGYQAFYDFNLAELKLIEPLRALRMIQYSGWLAKRWQDPAFPQHFPWFNTPQYWQQHITELNHQIFTIKQPALSLFN